jgi:hypothetical protein
MNEHLTEQQLIDYQFKLASDAGMSEARAHLDQCETCRGRLAALQRKFAALDLLREEVKPTETLISKTIELAAASRPARVIPLFRLPWLGVVAAAIIAAVALFVLPNRGPQEKAIVSKLPAPSGPKSVSEEAEEAVEADRMVASDRRAIGDAGSLTQRLAEAPEPSAPPAALGVGGSVGAAGIARSVPATVGAGFKPALMVSGKTPYGVTTNAQEPPPFAPASAIELVVLPRRENVQLTIYNAADLTLVRERRNLTLKQGWNWLQLAWASTLIDPTSLTLEPLEHKDQVQVQQLDFPPRLRELGRWLIHSDVTGQVPFELTYFTSGLAWRAFYTGTLSQDEKTMHLESYVRVDNHSGEDYENAQTRLIVGRIHLLDQIAELAKRQYPYGGPEGVRRVFVNGNRVLDELRKDKEPVVKNRLMDLAESEGYARVPKAVEKEGLSEYFLYTIEGTETIPDKWGKRLLSFQADDIPVKSLCKYDEQRWGTQTIRFLSFANDPNHKLGQTPLPDGAVRVYGRADDQGHLSYAGGMDVKYIPVGEKIELNLGPARLVEVKPILMEDRTQNHVFDSHGNVTGWDQVQTWKIEVTNATTLPVDIEITRGFDTAYWTLKPADTTASFEKYDVTHARFKLTVDPRTKRAFEYTVTIYRGVREQAFANGGQSANN